MPRKLEVDQHPKKKEIIKALVNKVSYRKIAERYGISQAALSRYLNNNLVEKATKAKQARDLKDGDMIVREIQNIMDRCRKMYDACDEWLTDPTNPEKYYLGPRAEEVEVVYIDEVPSGNATKQVKMKKRLYDLLREVYTGGEVVSLRSKHADPRELLLKTANTLNTQLDLLSKIIGAIKETQVNIIKNPSFIRVQNILIEVTKDYPEIREKIAKELEKID